MMMMMMMIMTIMKCEIQHSLTHTHNIYLGAAVRLQNESSKGVVLFLRWSNKFWLNYGTEQNSLQYNMCGTYNNIKIIKAYADNGVNCC